MIRRLGLITPRSGQRRHQIGEAFVVSDHFGGRVDRSEAISESPTHHADLDWAAEEVLDLFSTISNEAVTTVERASPRVISEDP
jgi:hypothetical protein